jgi:hypothetical protein
VLIRATALCLMICYGTTALASDPALIAESGDPRPEFPAPPMLEAAPMPIDRPAIHSYVPGTSLGIREPRPDSRPSSAWYRMDLTPMSEYNSSIHHLVEPAPPNGCGPYKFEVLNPWTGENRCVGAP